MKKLAIIALATFVLVGAAGATTVVVPFFNDDTANGFAGFVGIKNTTGGAITGTVAYQNPNGDSLGGGTFNLPSNTGASFQPFADNIANEGAVGNAVPDASAPVGSLVIVHAGGVDDIVGRYTQSRGTDSHAYNLSVTP